MSHGYRMNSRSSVRFVRSHRQFFLIRPTFCRANIADTNRYSLENVLLAFFRPFSCADSLSLSLLPCSFPPRPIDFAPYVADPPPYDRSSVSADTREKEGRRKVLFSRRGVFHFHPFASPLPSLTHPLSLALCSRFSSFFRAQIELYERVSPAKVPRDERAESKSQMEISPAIS